MTIKKVEIIADEHGTTVKLNGSDELQCVTFVQLKSSGGNLAELVLHVDVIPDNAKTRWYVDEGWK